MAKLSLKTNESELRNWYKQFLQVQAENTCRADMMKNQEFVSYFVKAVTKIPLDTEKVELEVSDI